jgi:mannose-6-phosphate isomerase-like protein (cupin superfamily)
MPETVHVTPWPDSQIPTEAAIRLVLDADGLAYSKWGNGPLDVYFAHSHSYNKVIYIVSGAITFTLPKDGEKLTLKAGDRLDLPAGTVHEAVVSTLGVECLEAHYD